METIAWNRLNENNSTTGYSKVHYIESLKSKVALCGKAIPSSHENDITDDNGESLCKICEKKGGVKSNLPSEFDMREANDRAENFGYDIPYPHLKA